MNIGGGTGSSASQASREFELNLAPIIDCMTVLITFMLASTAFLAVGTLSITVPGSAPVASSNEPPAIGLEIQLGLKGELHLKISGKRKLDKELPGVGGSWDLDALSAEVRALKREYPDLQSVMLSAQNDVEYGPYIRVMESLRSELPLVFLGGI